MESAAALVPPLPSKNNNDKNFNMFEIYMPPRLKILSGHDTVIAPILALLGSNAYFYCSVILDFIIIIF